jgi:hypothetical protein
MTTERTDPNGPVDPNALQREGGSDELERGEGRPLGVGDSARSGAEGRPSHVRDAEATERSSPEAAPTEDEVERGGTPDTEHQPGGDL